MSDTILQELKQIETRNQIRILLAVESGSRAWGFASKDSDWDVRFIYIHKPDWYLSIDNGKDNIEEMLPGNLDIAGWELRKTLKLFRKSNPPLFEWLQSPIKYLEQYSTAQNLRTLMSQYFNPKSCIYHYLSMAKGNFANYLQQDMVRTKKYFYVLRPIFACKWIEKHQEMAPIEFRTLMDDVELKESVNTAIDDLLSRKKNGDELDKEPKINEINDFLAGEISHFEGYVKDVDPNATPHTEKLNLLFRKSLKEVWK